MSIKALVTGSFDPVTTGHVDIIKRAAQLFDSVDAVAFINPDKSYMFDENKRIEMLSLSLSDIDNVRVFMDKGYVCDYVKRNDIDVIVRGIRNKEELEYELIMAEYNKLHSGAETLFIPADKKYADISSTYARQKILSDESLDGIIPDPLLHSYEFILRKKL